MIASGTPDGREDVETTADELRDAVDWALASSFWAAANSGTRTRTRTYGSLDADGKVEVGVPVPVPVPVAAAGQSCGGLHAYSLRNDERVAGLGIFNSGLLRGESLANNPIQGGVEDASVIAEVDKAVFWFMGGVEDVAYPNVSFSSLFGALFTLLRFVTSGLFCSWSVLVREKLI